MDSYELLVWNRVDGWRRFALLPVTLGFRLISVIAEEAQLAWIAPVRVVRGSELLMELGEPLPVPQVA